MSKGFITMVETSAIPFGYTATIWCSGALLIHFRAQPNVGDVFAFLAGALAEAFNQAGSSIS